MPLFVVHSFERWVAHCAIHGHTPAIWAPEAAPVEAGPVQPLRPFLFRPFAPQPQRGWNVSPGVEPTPTTRGLALNTQVIAWYAFRAPLAATQPQGQAADVPVVATVATPTVWTPIRQWARWIPQPAVGWTPASDTTLAPPTAQPTAKPWKAWQPQPQVGWTAPSRQDPNLTTPAPPWSPVKAWTRWTAQPQHGWTAPSQQDAALTTPGTPWAPIKAWATWKPQPNVGWTSASRQDENLSTPGPASIGRPYLFQTYRPQPQLGWAAPNAQDTELSLPAPPLALPKPWARWQPQPAYGWNAALSPAAVVEPEQPPQWAATRPWPRWSPQPAYGWASDSTVTPPPPTLGDAVSTQVNAYYERWSAKFAWLGWNPANDLPVEPQVPAPMWTPGKPWPRWLAQPALGWTQAGDQDLNLTLPAPAQSPVIPWRRAFTRQPQLGWSTSDAGVVVQVQEGPAWSPPVVWTTRWKLQPRLGWTSAGGVTPIVLEVAPGPNWAPTRQWQKIRPQPEHGWARIAESVGAAPPTVKTLMYQRHRWRRRHAGR
jgi:hypothetical protein